MLRAVLDTNIIVSASLRGDGRQAQILSLALSDVFRMCVSEAILEEYEGVLRRERFHLSTTKVTSVLEAIREHALLVHPKARIAASQDASDNMFLECAVEAGARFLVTGNLRHFPQSFRGVTVVSPLQFQLALPGLMT